jgi:hypothetical protein
MGAIHAGAEPVAHAVLGHFGSFQSLRISIKDHRYWPSSKTPQATYWDRKKQGAGEFTGPSL